MARKLRIECEQRTAAGGVLRDLRTGVQGLFYRGEAIILELALFSNGRMLLRSELTWVKVRWRNSGTLLTETVIASATLNSSLTAQQWRQGNAALVSVNFSAAATGDLPAGMLTLEVCGLTTGGESVFASGTIEAATLTGLTTGTPPTPSPPEAYTQAETDALLLAAEEATTGAIESAVVSRIAPELTYVPLIIFAGESNSGGLALNSSASTPELSAQAGVQILNPTTYLWEDLDIGTNNLLGHAGLTNGTTHGWELELANTVRAGGTWLGDTVYLVKTGQGGSEITDWDEGSSYWGLLKGRVDAARLLLEAAGLKPIPYVFYSQGINDAIATTPANTWKAATMEYLRRLRQYIGYAPIMITRLPSDRPTYTTAINEMATEFPWLFPIETSDASMVDGNHWDYTGMKLIAGRMIDTCVNEIGEAGAYLGSLAYIRNIRWTVVAPEVEIPCGPVPVTSTTGTPAAVVWGNFSNASSDGTYIENVGAVIPSGGRMTSQIDASDPFVILIDYPASHSDTAGAVVFISESATDDYLWTTGLAFVAGFYQYLDTVYQAPGGYDNIAEAGFLGAPCKLRMRGAGGGDTNVYIDRSVDGGATWFLLSTMEGVLAGVTDVYVRCLFAIYTGDPRVAVTFAT